MCRKARAPRKEVLETTDASGNLESRMVFANEVLETREVAKKWCQMMQIVEASEIASTENAEPPRRYKSIGQIGNTTPDVEKLMNASRRDTKTLPPLMQAKIREAKWGWVERVSAHCMDFSLLFPNTCL